VGKGQTHSNSQLLPQSRRNKTQHYPPHRDPHPKPRRYHTTGKLLSVTHFKHELDDPAPERDLNAHVPEEEEGAEPCDTRVRETDKRFLHAVILCTASAGVSSAECGAGFAPEGCY
jgi:hypothetical protein